MWISVKDARKRLDGLLALSTLYRLAHDGLVKATRIGGKIAIDSDSLSELVRAGELEVLKPPRDRKRERKAKRKG